MTIADEISVPSSFFELKRWIFFELPKLHGWCPEEKALSMVEMMQQRRIGLCVEVGVFAGRSLLPMALAAKLLGRGVVHGIDPWSAADSCENYLQDNVEVDSEFVAYWAHLDYDELYQSTKQLVLDYGVDRHVVLHRERADTAYKHFSLGGIDLLHIDGNHSDESANEDLDLYVPLLKSGGLLYFDDIDWESTQGAVKRLLAMGTVLYQTKTWLLLEKF